MKKLLALLLVTVLCLGALTACTLPWQKDNKEDPPAATAADAASLLFDLYKDSLNGASKSADFDVPKTVVASGVTFNIAWSASTDKITFKDSTKAGYLTVDLPSVNAEAFEFTLTASVSGESGEPAVKAFTLTVPVITSGAESTISEGVAYKLSLDQHTYGQRMYALATTQDNLNKFINTTVDPTEAADFYAEIVDGGYKIYTTIDGAKNYVYAQLVNGSKYIGFSTENASVLAYDASLGVWYVTLDNNKYGIGTYGDYKTICISEWTHFDAESVGYDQFILEFIPSAHAETLAPDAGEPTDKDTLTITEALALGLDFILYTKNEYKVTGTIDSIENAEHGNLYIKDAEGNKILVYGTYDITGSTKFGEMENAPKVGDTITVSAKVGCFDGVAQLKNARIVAINGEEVKLSGGYNYIFTDKKFTGNTDTGVDLGGVMVTLAGEGGGYWGYNDTKGQQFGSGGSPYTTMTLATLGANIKGVTTIKIATSGAKDISATLTVYVGETQIGQTISLTTSNQEYTFESATPLDGEVKLVYTATVAKAIYIKSISVIVADDTTDDNQGGNEGGNEGGDDNTDEAVAIAPTEPVGEFSFTYTYELDQVSASLHYTFKAPVAGTYTFTAPADIGVAKVSLPTTEDDSYVDFYNNFSGDTFSVELTEGQVIDLWLRGYCNEEGSSVTYTIAFTNAAQSGGDEGGNEGGDVGGDTSDMPTTIYKNITNTITLTADQLAGTTVRIYGQGYGYTFTSDNLTIVSVKDSAGNTITADSNGKYLLPAEDWCTVEIKATAANAEAGDYTLTVEAIEPAGTYGNPTILTSGTGVDINIAVGAYYYFSFTAPAYGHISYTSSNAGLVLTNDNTSAVIENNTAVLNGQTYVLYVANFGNEAVSATITLTFTEGTLTTAEWMSILANASAGTSFDDKDASFVEKGINVTRYNGTTLSNDIDLLYTYTVTVNADSSLTIVIGALDAEYNNIGDDIGITGKLLKATQNEWGGWTVEIVEEEDNTLTIPEAVEQATSDQAISTDTYQISGVIVNIASTTYGNMTIMDAEGNTIYMYGLSDADGNRYDAMTGAPVVGDAITVLANTDWFSGPQLKNAVLVSTDDITLSDIQKVTVEIDKFVVTTTYSEDVNVTLAANGTTYSDIGITWTVNGEAATTLTATQTAAAQTFTLVATFTLGDVTISKTYTVLVESNIVMKLAASISFDSDTGRESADSTGQVWNQNGIKFTTTSGNDYTNPVRIYKNKSMTIEYTGIAKLVIHCNNTTYANKLNQTIAGSTVNGKIVTVTLAAVANTYTATMTVDQVRIDSIDVYVVDTAVTE